MLVPNCPGAKLSGAKLSVFIMLVPNCPGAKLSGAKLSWCQIVLVPNCPVPNCPVPNCPTTGPATSLPSFNPPRVLEIWTWRRGVQELLLQVLPEIEHQDPSENVHILLVDDLPLCQLYPLVFWPIWGWQEESIVWHFSLPGPRSKWPVKSSSICLIWFYLTRKKHENSVHFKWTYHQ